MGWKIMRDAHYCPVCGVVHKMGEDVWPPESDTQAARYAHLQYWCDLKLCEECDREAYLRKRIRTELLIADMEDQEVYTRDGMRWSKELIVAHLTRIRRGRA